MKPKWVTAQHSGGLKECLATEQPITEKCAWALLGNHIYEFYGYDERIKADRYLLTDHTKNLGLPTWLHHYLGDEKWKGYI